VETGDHLTLRATRSLDGATVIVIHDAGGSKVPVASGDVDWSAAVTSAMTYSTAW